MTIKKDFKKIIRQRQHETGESYMVARAHVLREREALSSKPQEVTDERSEK